MRTTLITILALVAAIISFAAQPTKSPAKRIAKSPPIKQSAKKQPSVASNKAKATRVSAVAKSAVKTPARSLVLLYTSSADGQIRSCNCTKFRFGGYGRELTLLKSIRAKCPDTLLIEGGDLCGDTGFQAELKAKVSAQAMALLGYNLVVPGEKELGVRGVRYSDHFNSKSVPLICANVFSEGSDKPLFRPFVILKTAGGLQVAVIGLIAPSVCEPWLRTSYGEVVRDPIKVLGPIVKQVRPKADLVVVVYHGVIDPASSMAKAAGVDLVLTTHKHSQDRLFPGEGANTVPAPVSRLGSAVLVKSETSTNWCLGRIDLELDQKKKIKSAKHALFYLDRSYEEAPAMVKIYDKYNEDVKAGVIANSAAFKKKAEGMLTKRGLNLVEMRQRMRKISYATAGRCADCHKDIHESWSKTRHAHAMATLKKTKQEFDPECVRCHVTGAMQRGGFTNAEDTPELGDVQCEACHGSAIDHVSAPAKGFGRVMEETCRACHTDERTPNFDYEKALEKIKH